MLRKISDKAANEVVAWLNIYGGDNLLDMARDSEGRNLVDVSYLIAQKYGNASASVAEQMCEAIATLSGVPFTPADLAELPTYGDVAKTVYGTLKTSQNHEEISSAVGRLVKRTGDRTTQKFARNTGAQYAWIPNGDTCAFCIVLASRGWEKRRNTVEHLHSNCDCTYAIRYNKDTSYAGYDPEEYYKQYSEAEGQTSKQKINSMRRKYYAENRELILAQKADAYAKRQELNASSAEELNIQ